MMPDTTQPNDEFAFLLHAATGWILQSANRDEFLDRMGETGPIIAPEMARLLHSEAEPAQFFRTLGVHVYDNTPLPDEGFAVKPVPKPSRNQPCPCGSGLKYKHCCIHMSDLPLLDNYNMLRHVLDYLPQKKLAILVDSRADTHAIADTAAQWIDEGEDRRALALLEPWFKNSPKLGRRHIPLFVELVSIYQLLNKPLKCKRLVHQVSKADNESLRALALQHLATEYMNKGDLDAANASFMEAQRLDPDSYSLAILELSLLCLEGNDENAKSRARFMVARFRKLPDTPPDFLKLLEDCTENPSATLLGFMAPEDPILQHIQMLSDLLISAPEPTAYYQLKQYGQEAMLHAGKKLHKPEQKWFHAFHSIKPSLTHTQHGDTSVWDNAPQWLNVLHENPLLWNSFDVLDDLVMAIDALHAEDMGFDLFPLNPILERAQTLLELHIKNAVDKDMTLPWGITENRPALRLLAHRIFRLSNTVSRNEHELMVAAAEQLIKINPVDNHGIRSLLSTAYIFDWQLQKAVSLTEQYPDDILCTLPMNRILALYLDKQENDALEHLSKISERYKTVIDMLLAKNPDPPPISEYGISIGGEDEAWLYREDALSLWQRHGALNWLRKVIEK